MGFEIENGILKKYYLVIVKDVLYNSYHNKSTEIVIPDGITAISEKAFYSHEALESITLPDSIAYIWEEAFFNCESLKSINIPDNINFIGNGAFALCKGLADEQGFVIIKNTLYCYCGNDTDVIIPENVTSISQRAFSSCYSIKSLTLTDNIDYIDKNAFLFCGDIKKLTIRKNMKYIELDFRLIDEKGISNIFTMILKNDYSIKLNNSEKLDYILKNYLSAHIFIQYPQPEVENYIKENIEDIIILFIKLNDHNTIRAIAECGNFILEYDIMDSLIDCAAENTQKGGNVEIQSYLMDYKHRHFPDSDIF